MAVLTDLPSVYVCKLLGFLDWRTKLQLVSAVPEFLDCLSSRPAWPHVRNTASTSRTFSQPSWASLGKKLSLHDDEEHLNDGNDFRDCIRNYGQYFQNCRLVLEFEDVYMCQMDQTLLHLVTEHCSALRSLSIQFPRGLGFKILQCIGDYRFILNRIPKKCPKLKDISIQILEYSAVMETRGVAELFQVEDKNGLVPRLTEFDFSYMCIHEQNVPQADFLHHFTGLRTLKVADHLLTLDVVISLFDNGLKDLYISNNSLTRDFNAESSVTALDWDILSVKYPHICMHYNYSCAQILPWTFKRNPLVKTLVLDSLFNYITAETLNSIGKQFPNLTVFAQLSSEWSYQHYDDTLDTESMYCQKLLANTPNLHTFVTSLTISSTDLLGMAEYPNVKCVVVNEEEIFYDLDYVEDQRTYVGKRMSMVLGGGWKPLREEEFVRYSTSLLS